MAVPRPQPASGRCQHAPALGVAARNGIFFCWPARNGTVGARLGAGPRLGRTIVDPNVRIARATVQAAINQEALLVNLADRGLQAAIRTWLRDTNAICDTSSVMCCAGAACRLRSAERTGVQVCLERGGGPPVVSSLAHESTSALVISSDHKSPNACALPVHKGLVKGCLQAATCCAEAA